MNNDKAILIIDKMPNLCGECICSKAYIGDEGQALLMCKATKKTVSDVILVSGFREGTCPLKVLPQSKIDKIL